MMEGESLSFPKRLTERKTAGSAVIRVLFSLAYALRNTEALAKREGHFDLSAMAVRTVKLILSRYMAEVPSLKAEFEATLAEVKQSCAGEQELLFELLDASMFTPSVGAKVRLMKLKQRQTLQFDQQFEVVLKDNSKKKKKKRNLVTVFDAEREKFKQFKQADLRHFENNPVAPLLSDACYKTLEATLQSEGCSYLLRCFITKLLIKNSDRIQDKASLVAYLKSQMFEGREQIASDVYQVGYDTFCFYQPILFEEAIAYRRKLDTDIGSPGPFKKPKAKMRASEVTYRHGQPIKRIQDTFQTQLREKPVLEKPVNNPPRQLIKNLFRVANESKQESKKRKQLLKDTADLWLLFSKVGFALFEKNQRFESTNLSVPVKVVYALLSFDDNFNLKADLAQREQFLRNFVSAFKDESVSFTKRQMNYIKLHLTRKLQKVLAHCANDEEVIDKVLSVDLTQVDQAFVDLLENSANERFHFFSRQLAKEKFESRSEYNYYKKVKASRFPKALNELNKSGVKEPRLLRELRERQVELEPMMLGALSSSLLYSIYNPAEDATFDKPTLDRIQLHYHFLKKNKNVNMQEYVWSDVPPHCYSIRYQEIMLQALKVNPNLVKTMLVKEATQIRTYMYEACLSSNDMVQAQVFSHHLIGLLRLIAASDELFLEFATTYWPLVLKELILLTFQSSAARKDYDDEFALYSDTLARKICDSLVVFALKTKQHFNHFAQSGKLDKITGCKELGWISESLKSVTGQFKQFRKTKLQLFGLILLEVFTTLQETIKLATSEGFKVQPLLREELLDGYQIVKAILSDKKDQFAAISTLQGIYDSQVEQPWTEVEVGSEWTKLELGVARKTEIQFNLTDPQKQVYFANRTVVVSDSPEINSKSQFYQIHGESMTIQVSQPEVFVKFLKDESFLSYLVEEERSDLDNGQEKLLCHPQGEKFKSRRNREGVCVEIVLSKSQLGAEPCQVYIDRAWAKPEMLVVADQGRRLFFVFLSLQTTENGIQIESNALIREVKLPKEMHRIKWISEKHSNQILKEWSERETGTKSKSRSNNKLFTVLSECGKMFALEFFVSYQVRDKKIEKFYSWEQYPSLPKDQLVDYLAIDDEKMFAVTKQGKLYAFSTHGSLNEKDKQKFKQCILIQKFMVKVSLRDGSDMKSVSKAWIQKTDIDGKQFRAQMIQCQTTNAPAVCSSGERSMLGRPTEDGCKANCFHILSYENEMTTFVKVDVAFGLAMAIDQSGELWVLSGRQSIWLNAGMPPCVKDEKGNHQRRKIFTPVRTDIMQRRKAKAIDIKIGQYKTYVRAEDKKGQQFVFFIGDHSEELPPIPNGRATCAKVVESHFQKEFNNRVELAYLVNGVRADDQHYQIAMILRQRNDQTKLNVKFRPLDLPIKLGVELKPRCYSEQAKSLFKKFMDSAQGVRKVRNEVYQEDIISFFKDFKEVEDQSQQISDEVVQEVAELKEFHFKIFNFMYETLKLASVAANDIYFGMKRRPHQVPESLDVNLTRGLIRLFQSSLKEFSNFKLHQLLVSLKIAWFSEKELDDNNRNPRVEIDRLKAEQYKQANKHEPPTEFNSIFSQIFSKVNPSNLMIRQDDPFNVKLKNEHAYDAGGVRRDIISNICSELSSPLLGLLVPTGNNLANYGEYTQCFTLNPRATSVLELERLQFLGLLIGWSVNARQGLGLDLAPHIWKRLVAPAAKFTIDDLQKVDAKQAEMLKHMLACKGMSSDEFSDYYPDQFLETDFGQGRLVELCPGGSKIKLTQQTVGTYVDLYIEHFFKQDSLQFEAFERGVEAVCGKMVLSMMDEAIVEARACSTRQVSFQAMKRQFILSSLDSRTKKNFLWCLKEMTNSERQSLLKFISGASRLIPGQNYEINNQYPDSGSESDRSDGRPPKREDKVDQRFPVGHTCGFSMDLADYSSKEIMLKQIRKAIEWCGEIDADGDYYDEVEDDYGDSDGGDSYGSSDDGESDYGEESDGESGSSSGSSRSSHSSRSSRSQRSRNRSNSCSSGSMSSDAEGECEDGFEGEGDSDGTDSESSLTSSDESRSSVSDDRSSSFENLTPRSSRSSRSSSSSGSDSSSEVCATQVEIMIGPEKSQKSGTKSASDSDSWESVQNSEEESEKSSSGEDKSCAESGSEKGSGSESESSGWEDAEEVDGQSGSGSSHSGSSDGPKLKRDKAANDDKESGKMEESKDEAKQECGLNQQKQTNEKEEESKQQQEPCKRKLPEFKAQSLFKP